MCAIDNGRAHPPEAHLFIFFCGLLCICLTGYGQDFPRRGVVLGPIFRQSKLEISFWPVLRQEGGGGMDITESWNLTTGGFLRDHFKSGCISLSKFYISLQISAKS